MVVETIMITGYIIYMVVETVMITGSIIHMVAETYSLSPWSDISVRRVTDTRLKLKAKDTDLITCTCV